ncbi:FAD-dependent oxidoreductase [Paralcaligenes sp. KSB-10]|uniref:FAD-dependent oxidoreductase n=1 Tax=Paralcaligenes sp. KSB-10 TaxID=2901142 RepID=UPI001E328356|nr:FAD-dependent oxidoreductase [Paralcaligenes sp. KSB-10]UHL63096.1 FAD-dependent oxidoreductase [Paralcaligenes sp. KSB-10]
MEHTEFDYEADVVVVGAGACGLMAAYRAGLQGLDVILLDKDSRLGCNAEIASGSLPAAGTHHQRAAGIEDSPERMAADILRKNKGRADARIVHALCALSTEIIRIFEEDLGVPIELNQDAGRSGFSALRLHNGPGRTGAPLIRALQGALARMNNITHADRTPGMGLIIDAQGAVNGVRAGPDGEQCIGAKRVILACDGFGSNQDMIARYIPEMAGIDCIGVQGNTGDAIRWGLELGAAVAHMSAYQGHGLVCAGYGTRLSPEIPQLGAVIVNRQGRRFAREDQGYSEFAQEVLAQADQQAIAIFDQNMFDVVARLDHWKETVASGAIKSAPTLAQLAERFKLPPEALQQSFEECAGIRPDPWDRAGLPVPQAPPFYGAVITGAMVHTQGGLVVDVHARVKRPDGSRIPNLYAGGGSAAGISGDCAQGYMSGNGLLSAYGLGMIAGDHAAQSLLVHAY